MIKQHKKKCFIERLIQWLKDVETRKYRQCCLCVHIDDSPEVYAVSDGWDSVILSPCLACNRNHDCFKLNYEKLAEEVESGLITKGVAKHVNQKYENDQLGHCTVYY